MRIAVIGTGYVGLVAGACFADTGNHVSCVDKDAGKIESLKRGEIPIFEPGLETLVKRCMGEGRLVFSTSTSEAVRGSQIVFLAVGTPALPGGEPDLSFLKEAAEEVGRSITGYCLIVNKSTVPIGAHEVVAEWVGGQTQHPFDVVSNPEFLKEGTALEDFLKPDRIVIGTRSREVFQKMLELYAPFVRQGNPILWMDPVSAEITKYACNAFLATRISFMNELASLCEMASGDIEEVRRGMITDTRIGKHFLYAGLGYGGSCFPKDVQALLATAGRLGVPMGIVEAARNANVRQVHSVLRQIRDHFGSGLAGRTVAIWGLSFKPNTDDIREAPSIRIIRELLKEGARVQAYDPVAMRNVEHTFPDLVAYGANGLEAARGADALVLVTEWNEFRHPDFEALKAAMNSPVLFDGRNIYDPERVRKMGFTYYGIGRRVAQLPAG